MPALAPAIAQLTNVFGLLEDTESDSNVTQIMDAAPAVLDLVRSHPRAVETSRQAMFAPVFYSASASSLALDSLRADGLAAFGVGALAMVGGLPAGDPDLAAALVQGAFGADAAGTILRSALLGGPGLVPPPSDPLTPGGTLMPLPQVPDFENLLGVGLVDALSRLAQHGADVAGYNAWLARATATAAGISSLDPPQGCAGTRVRILGGPFPTSSGGTSRRPSRPTAASGDSSILISVLGQRPADWHAVFPLIGGGYGEAEVVSWSAHEIVVIAPAGVGSGCVGFVHTDGPPPAGDGPDLGAAEEVRGILTQLLGAAGFTLGTSLERAAGALVRGPFPEPQCLPADPGGEPANRFVAGPPLVRAFTVNGKARETVVTGDAITLAWRVENAEVVRIVVKTVDGLANELPPITVPPGASSVGPLTLTMSGIDDWLGAYELQAFNRCAGLGRRDTLDASRAVTSTVTVEVRDAPTLFGIADTHVHFGAHKGFGGLAIWGEPVPTDPALPEAARLASALGHCDPLHGPGGTAINLEGGSVISGHLVGGFPEFDGWPKSTTVAHQQAYVDWIRRSVDGGLRLAVCLAVNNELAANRIDSRRPGNGPPTLPYDDRSTVILQLAAMRELVDVVAQQAALTGEDPWMEIAESPADARRIVAAGHLALVLGVEVDSLGGWRTPEALKTASGGDLATARGLIAAYLDELASLGVRHVFPVHLSNNAFGGAAIYNRTFDALNMFLTGASYAVEDGSAFGISYRIEQDDFAGGGLAGAVAGAIAYSDAGVRGPDLVDFETVTPRQWVDTPGGHINTQGLTEYGVLLIEELMRRGMLIDVDHMSQKTTDAVMTMVETRTYPVVSGHTGFRELNYGFRDSDSSLPSRFDRDVNAGIFGTSMARRLAHEGNKAPCMIDRIRRVQGMISPILDQGDLKDCGCYVANDAPGSSKTFAQALLYAIERMHGRHVGLGSDINGGAALPGPRFGTRAAESIAGDDVRASMRRGFANGQTEGVRYTTPITEYRDTRFPAVDVYNQEERDIWEAIAIHKAAIDPATAYRPPSRTVYQQGKIVNIAKGFGYTERGQIEDPLLGGNTRAEQTAGFLVGENAPALASDPAEAVRLRDVIRPIWAKWDDMAGSNAGMVRSVAGRRDFDINIDGMAHYGMLPDLLEDMVNVGVQPQDMAVLHRSAEDYIRVWERCLQRKLPPMRELPHFPGPRPLH